MTLEQASPIGLDQVDYFASPTDCAMPAAILLVNRRLCLYVAHQRRVIGRANRHHNADPVRGKHVSRSYGQGSASSHKRKH
ncbi:hypothetical protein [Acidiferrobacter sp.]|uniref:hypothetical protein n=1 Tax=Acidiferrobacter sp. TaxID=1872107 RepID=UPI0026331810|nr:hypothetical protein [Acidiferrobacter sp.]